MAKETLGVAIQTGYEHDPEAYSVVGYEFRCFVMGALKEEFPDLDVRLVGDMPAEQPESPQEELLAERRRLEEIEQSADMVAILLNGNPPDPRSAILGGFAVGRHIPIAAIRTAGGSTGEAGLSFNLMLHAAIERSRGYEASGWRTPLHLAESYPELCDELVDAAEHHLTGRPAKVSTDKDGVKSVYAASPFGFAESTRGFYGGDYLSAIKNLGAEVIDPWETAQQDIDVYLAAPEWKKPRALVRAGVNNIAGVESASVVVAGVDQEPPDVGTLVELGVAAANGMPIVLYRNDLRRFTSGPADFDAAIQAAATYYLPEDEAAARADRLAASVPEVELQLKAILDAELS